MTHPIDLGFNGEVDFAPGRVLTFEDFRIWQIT